MMEQEAKLAAGGRKGVEAIDVDVSGMLVGDWLTVQLEEGFPVELRITRLGTTEWRLEPMPSYNEARRGDSPAYAHWRAVGDLGTGLMELGLKMRADPAADLAKAKAGEFTS